MYIAVLSGFVASLAAPWLHRFTRNWTGWIIALLPLGLLAYFASFAGSIAAGSNYTISYPWVPQLGVNLAFNLDGLSLLMAMLITGIGALIAIYAGSYLAGHEQLGRFYAYLLMFMAAMLGAVLSDNLFSIFVFWELTSLSSYLLIGFKHEEAESRAAALQALVVTGGGGLALLAGFVLLAQIGGSTEITLLATQGEVIRAHPLYLPALLLVLAGAFTKSAQTPFHFWLPSAMAAPTPVSAYLHSATMVKLGVYLLARMSPILSGTIPWLYLVAGVGVLTMLVGAYLALYFTDLKRILAYSTVSSLGTMVLLIGLQTSGGIKAALVFLMAHALYKGALFMIAGAIDHETGTRDVDQLSGLRRSMPILAGVAVLAALSLAAFGPLLSFIGKELLFEAVLEAEHFSFIFTPAAILAGGVSVAVALILVVRPFFGAELPTPKHPHEPPIGLWLGPALLGGLGLLIGLFPTAVARLIISPAATVILGEPYEAELALWHGINLALGLSVVSIATGLLLYRGWAALRRATSRLERFLRWGPSRVYDSALDGLNTLARVQTRILQSGYLSYYLLIIIVTAVALAGYTLAQRGRLALPPDVLDVQFYELAVAVLILLAAVGAVRSRSRLGAVAALGVVGYGVSLIFILFGAPDLAMTQFLVETLTVILLVLVFYHLPRLKQLSSRREQALDLVVAIGAGALMTAFVLMASGVQFFPPISDYYLEQSVPLAHGRNVVNVILVDFRALDTLGEITVLALAGVGVYALLKLRLGKKHIVKPDLEEGGSQ